MHDVHTGLLAGLRAQGPRRDRIRPQRPSPCLTGDAGVPLAQAGAQQGGPLADVRPTPADVQYHAGKDVLERALRDDAEWVVVVCAAYLHPDCLILCRRAGLRLAAVFTESPYDDAEQAKVAPAVRRGVHQRAHQRPPPAGGQPRDPLPPHGLRPGAARAADERGGAGATTSSSWAPASTAGSRCSPGGLERDRPGPLRGLGRGAGRATPWRPTCTPAWWTTPAPGRSTARPASGSICTAGTGGAPAESLNPRAYELAADGVFTVAQPRAEQTERLGGSVATFTTPAQLEEAHPHPPGRRLAPAPHGRGASRPWSPRTPTTTAPPSWWRT